MSVTAPTARIGIRYRVGALGALGIVGLVLVGCLYVFGEREQNAMKRQASAAATASMFMSRVLNDLSEARLFAGQFSLTGTETQVGQEAVALEAVDRSLAEIGKIAGVNDTTQAGAALTAKAVKVYGALFGTLVELKRSQGLSTEDGLAARLAVSGEAAEAACDRDGSDGVRLMLARLRGVEVAFDSRHDPQGVERFKTGLADMLAAVEQSTLDDGRKRALASTLSTYLADFLAFVEQARLIGQAQRTMDEAYQEARVAADAARGLALARSDEWEATIATAQERTARWMLRALGGTIGVVGVLALLLGHTIAAPLERVAAATSRLAMGDEHVAISDVGRGDEVGDVARALAVFRQLSVEFRSLTEQREIRRKEEEAARYDAVHALAGRIEAAIGSVIGALTGASERMNAGAEAVVTTVGLTRTRAADVAKSSQHCSAGVQSVASATEELAMTLDEVSRQFKHSADSVGRASAQVHVSGEIVDTLAAKAVTIENVLALIANIASRTNLLALNASIEAARAGAAGLGFAVVATEIKALAQQTGKATETIRHQIGDMQVATTRAVDAIGAIHAEFAGMDQVATAVAIAVEQQQEATNGIARSAQQVAWGVGRVSEAAVGLHSDAEHADSIAEVARQASAGVAEIADELTGSLDRFLSDLRARA